MTLRHITLFPLFFGLAAIVTSCATMGTEAHLQKPKGKGPISTTLEDNSKNLDACIPQSYNLNSGESLKMIVGFTLTAEGKVRDLDVESMSSPDPEFRICILRKLKKMQFPPTADGQDQKVRYPLVFVQSAG